MESKNNVQEETLKVNCVIMSERQTKKENLEDQIRELEKTNDFFSQKLFHNQVMLQQYKDEVKEIQRKERYRYGVFFVFACRQGFGSVECGGGGKKNILSKKNTCRKKTHWKKIFF